MVACQSGGFEVIDVGVFKSTESGLGGVVGDYDGSEFRVRECCDPLDSPNTAITAAARFVSCRFWIILSPVAKSSIKILNIMGNVLLP